jgi:hypothetical protein
MPQAVSERGEHAVELKRHAKRKDLDGLVRLVHSFDHALNTIHFAL